MKTEFYLSNGQQCTLIEKRVDGKFLVDPHYYFDEYNEQEYETIYTKPSNTLVIVDKIFNVPPIEAIDGEFKALQEDIKVKKAELSLVKKEISGLTQQSETLKKGMTNINRWIVDISQFKEAKTIACFLKDEPYPSIVHREDDDYSWRKNVITFEIRTHEHRDWTCSWYGRKNGSDFTANDVDPAYGFYFDISDEQLTKIALERNAKLNVELFRLHTYQRCDDKYFTDAMREHYNGLRAIEDNKKREILKSEIEKKQAELDKLTNELAA